MTRAWRALLLVPFLAVPAQAQDEPTPVDEAPAEEVPAEEAPAEAAPAEDAPAEVVPAEAAPAEEATAEAAPAEEAPADEAASEEEGEPWQMYVGVDVVNSTVSSSGGSLGAASYDSGMHRLRIGRRMWESIGLEFHYGLDNGGDGPGEVATDDYMGLFVVPTATMLETVELAFPVGYAQNSVSGATGSGDFNSIAYGFNAELPLRRFGEDLPDLRFGLGWMVYYQKTDARIYGANFGVRYDFTTDTLFGNPFAWIGGIDLWPFGDDEEQPEE